MPLLDRKEHPPGARVPPKGADEVFVIRCTGELVQSYEEYTHKRNLYARHDWSDKYYGRSGLTYEEALRIEEQTESLLKEQFPKELEEFVVKQIHHSRLRKDDLISHVHGSLKPTGVKPADSGKENGTPVSGTPGAPPVTKKLLGLFLVYVADKHKPGIWICKEQWVQKYGLPTELPDGSQLTATQPSSPRNATATIAVGDATPMKSPVQKSTEKQPPPVRTLEEEEARLRGGSMKAVAFNVLKARGTQPTTADDIIRISTIDGTRSDWSDNARKQLGQVLGSDSTFTRVARGQYVLTALAKDMPLPEPSAAASAGKGGSAAANDDTKVSKTDKDDLEVQEAAGLARAEQLLAQAQKAVAARQADSTAANEQLEVCEKRLLEAKKENKASTKSSPAKSAEGMPSTEELDKMFALPEDLKEYTGPEDDRKAKSSWRQEKAKKEKELAAARANYLQQQRLKAAKEAGGSLTGLQQAFDRAKKTAEEASARLGKALKAEAEAKRTLEKEKQREMLKGIKEKAKEDKEKQKQAEKEEREKRRQEALAAKRYPIDDLELLLEELTGAAAAAAAAGTGVVDDNKVAGNPLQPAEQLDLTCLTEAKHLGQGESLEMSQMLYVADTLSQFSKQLGVKGCSHAELASMLAAAAVGADNVADAGEHTKERVREALLWLGGTYHQLMKVLVEDVTQVENSARVFDRWLDALESGAGAWPELARRWVGLQEQDHLASPEALSVAEFLRTHEASELRPQQHLILLTQLLDDCMDTYRIRDALANRIEKGAELAAEIRAELAEGRKKLRELADAEKESKRKKRAAALALATAAAERQLREKGEMSADAAAADPASAAGEGKGADSVAASDAAASGSGKDVVARKIQATTKEILARVAGTGAANVTLAELEAELAGDVEEEPSWELPPELQQYSGPEGDKKLMSEFRRKQQEARKKLDKERTKWQAGKAERSKARAEAKKKEMEAERRLQAERKRAEQELAEQQEALELKLEKYLVRRQPLGSDRFNRNYWWGLAGNKDGLLLQQETGCAEATWKLLQEAAVASATQQRASVDKVATAKASAEPTAMDVDAQQAQQEAAEMGDSAGVMNGNIKPESGRASLGDDSKAGAALSWPLNHKGLLLPAGPEGWAVLDDVQLLEVLLSSLEQRGVREKELKQTIEKMLPAISSAISKAAAAKAAAANAAAEAKAAEASSKKVKKDKELVIQRELPSRHARAAAAEQIKKTGSAARLKDEPSASSPAAVMSVDVESGVFSGWQLAAVKNTVDNLQQLSAAAEAAKVSCPDAGSSWGTYRKQLHALLQGDVPALWAKEAASAAPALTTCGGILAAAADAAWSKAVGAAAAAGTPAAASNPSKQAAQAAAAAVAQLRLQLLAIEQQVVGVTGELAYLYRGSAGAENNDEPDGESEGEVEDAEQWVVQQQQQRCQGKPTVSKKGRADSSKGLSSPQDEQDAGPDAMDIDQVEQQPPAQTTPTDAKGKSAAASSAGRRGTKRAASAVSSDCPAAAGRAEDEAGSKEVVSRKPNKKTKAAAAASDLPPRPSRHAGRGPSAATAGDAGEQDGEPVSREGSAAPACSSDAAAAALKRGASRKRNRGAAVASRATSEEAAQDVDAQHKQQSRQKKTSKTAAGRKAQDSVQITGSTDNGAVSDADDDAVAGKRRHMLPHHKHDETGQSGDPDEEVAEESDDVIPIRLRGKAIWLHGDERDSWRASVAAAATTAGLSYLSAALLFHASKPLEVLAAAKSAAGKKGGKKQ